MNYDLNDTPTAQFERYIAAVEERPRRRVKPARWWHFLPVGLALSSAAALWFWVMGRSFRAW